MTSQPHKEILRRFYITYGVIAVLAYLFLMVVAFPWWQATNRPVSMTLGAGERTEILLGYSSRESALPLVATGKIKPFHWQWATELPPRPTYDLFLEFPNGSDGEIILKEIAILNLQLDSTKIPLDLTGLGELSGKGVRIRKLGNDWGLTAQKGASLNLPSEFPQVAPSRWFKDWVVATWGFLLVAVAGLLILAAAFRFPNGIEPRKRLIPIYETAVLLIGLLAGTAAQMHLLSHAIPGYSPNESTAYLMDALVSGIGSSTSLAALPYFINPPPLYPIFLRISLNLLNGDLNAVILLQGALYCSAVSLLAFSFRRLVHGYLIGIISLVVFISPAAVWSIRQIQYMSLFSTCWIFAIAAFIFLWQRHGVMRLAGWVLFGLATASAVCIHPSGLVLLALPVFLLIGALWWSYSNRGLRFWRIPILWSTVGQTAIPMTIVFGVFYAFTWFDSLDSSAQGMNEFAELERSHSPFTAGYFDATALGTGTEYAGLIRARADAGYAFNGWSLRQFFLDSRKEHVETNRHDLINEVNMAQAEFNDAIRQVVPFRARLAAMGRVIGWAISSPKLNSHSLEPISPSYKVTNTFLNSQTDRDLRRKLSLVASGTELPLRMTKAVSDPWVFLYNRTVVALYPWTYRILFLLALVAWLLSLSDRKYLATALIPPFLFLVLYHVYMIHVLGEELQPLDAIIWMTALCGFSAVSKNTLQTETAEDDRRCLPPVKPKRLLTRHAPNRSSLL